MRVAASLLLASSLLPLVHAQETPPMRPKRTRGFGLPPPYQPKVRSQYIANASLLSTQPPIHRPGFCLCSLAQRTPPPPPKPQTTQPAAVLDRDANHNIHGDTGLVLGETISPKGGQYTLQTACGRIRSGTFLDVAHVDVQEKAMPGQATIVVPFYGIR